MGYRNCPGCFAQNRDTDEKCYNCEAELAPKKTAAPGGVIETPVEPGQEHEASSRRLAELIEESHGARRTNWTHGIRAGAAGGAFLGVFYAGFLAFFGAMFGSLAGYGQGLQAELAGAALGGLLVFGIAFVSQIVYSIVIAVIAGALDVLCYQMDTSKIGATIGLVWGLYSSGLNPYGLMASVFWGSATGWMASFAEKSWFRKQYAEM